MERMLTGELNHHLGYEKHDAAGYNSGNSRNGKSSKTLKGEAGEMVIETDTAYGAVFSASSPAGPRCRATATAPSSRS